VKRGTIYYLLQTCLSNTLGTTVEEFHNHGWRMAQTKREIPVPL